MPTVREHYEYLEKTNPKKFADFNAELGRHLLTDTFKRGALKNDRYNIKKFQSPLNRLVIEFLGFSVSDLDNNTVPEIKPSKPLTQ